MWIDLELLTQILELSNHEIPYYAYGDNEAACEMSERLNKITSIIVNIIGEIDATR